MYYPYTIVKFFVNDYLLIIGDHTGLIYRYLLENLGNHTVIADAFTPPVYVI